MKDTANNVSKRENTEECFLLLPITNSLPDFFKELYYSLPSVVRKIDRLVTLHCAKREILASTTITTMPVSRICVQTNARVHAQVNRYDYSRIFKGVHPDLDIH